MLKCSQFVSSQRKLLFGATYSSSLVQYASNLFSVSVSDHVDASSIPSSPVHIKRQLIFSPSLFSFKDPVKYSSLVALNRLKACRRSTAFNPYEDLEARRVQPYFSQYILRELSSLIKTCYRSGNSRIMWMSYPNPDTM